jgi:hypothetical protein
MAKKRIPTAKAFGSNVAAVVSDKRHLRDIGGMFVGASLYAMVPTLVSKFFKVDTSGIKGVLLGVGAGLVGAGFGGLGYSIFAGSIGAMFGHLWWSQLNGPVSYSLTGQYLWRWDPTAKSLGMQAAPQSFADGGVSMVTLPNGSVVPVYTAAPANVLPESKVAGLADYRETLADYSTTLSPEPTATLADYSETITLQDELMGMSQFDEQYAPYEQVM